MLKRFSIILFILVLGLMTSSSKGLAEESPFIGYAGGGYNGKLMIFSIPGLELLKEVSVGVDMQGPVSDGKNLFLVDKAQNTISMVDLSGSSVKKSIKLFDF